MSATNTVSRKDGCLPKTQDQMGANAVLDKEGCLVNVATFEQLERFKFEGDKLKTTAVIEGDVLIELDVLQDLTGEALVEEFGEVSIPSATETVLASATVPTGKKLRIKHVFGEMNADAIFRVYIDSVKKWQARNAWTERNVQDDLEIEGLAGEVIQLRVVHSRPLTHTASGGFSGYEL